MATYYFSTSGNDSRTSTEAQNQSTPWASITKLNASWSIFQPGDSILFKKGDVFFGTITVGKSGTSGNPITLGAYGTGNKPVITGMKSIVNWTTLGGNKYISNAAVTSLSTTVLEMLTINDVIMGAGRFPKITGRDTGWLTNKGSSTTTSIRDNDSRMISGGALVKNWVGANIVVRPNAWYQLKRPIATHTASGGYSVITWTSPLSATPSANYGYWIQDHIDCVTQHGDWYFDPSTKKVTIYLNTAPSNYTIQTTDATNVLVSAGFHYITYDGLEFKGAHQNVVNITGSTNFTIKNCKIWLGGLFGLNIRSSGNNTFLIEDNEVCYNNDTGIEGRDSGINKTVQRNYVHHCGTEYPGATVVDPTQHGFGIIFNSGDNLLIAQNKVEYIAYAGVRCYANTFTIEKNDISNYCYWWDDGGGIYGGNQAFSSRTGLKTVRYNLIHDAPGTPNGAAGVPRAHGIYTDDNSENYNIHDNYIWNIAKFGVYVHNAHDINVHDNWIFNAGYTSYSANQGGVWFNHDTVTGSGGNPYIMNDLKWQNNVIVQKSTQQPMVQFNHTVSNNGEGVFALDSDINNNFYCRVIRTSSNPANENAFKYAAFGVSGIQQDTFSEWKARFGWDLNSTEVTTPSYPIGTDPTVPFEIFYNNTMSPVIETLTRSYRDGKGNIYYPGDVELLAMTALFLIKSDDVDPTPDPPIPPPPPDPGKAKRKNNKAIIRNNKLIT